MIRERGDNSMMLQYIDKIEKWEKVCRYEQEYKQ